MLVDIEHGAGRGLAFGPDVVKPRRRLVGKSAGSVQTGLRAEKVIANRRHAVRGAQHPLPDAVVDLAAGNPVGIAPQRCAVGDRDQANPIGGDIDGIHGQIEVCLVLDMDSCVTTGHPKFTAASAQNLAGNIDLPPLGHDRIQNNHALVGIKESVDRRPAISAKANALAHAAEFIGEIHRLARIKGLVNVQRNAVESALNQAVEVEVTGIDVDRAHREHAGTWRVDRLAQRQQLRRAQVGKAQSLGCACGVVHLGAEGPGEVNVLAWIGAHMQPVLGGQIEVARGRQGHRARTKLAADIDATLFVGQNQFAILVDDAANHVQVLRRLRYRKAAEVVIASGISVLHNTDNAVARSTRAARPENRALVEIHRAGGQSHEFAIHHIHTAVLADADVIDQQSEQGVVDHRDLGLAVGLQATRQHGCLHRPGGIGAAIGANKDRTRCRNNGRQLQKELVKLRLGHQCFTVRGGLG